jgi:vacuolar-type H+-ATPase subunit I/STV1
MPINFKRIPWRSPTRPITAAENIEKQKTEQVVQEQFEQLNMQLEVEQDFDDLAKTEQLQLNLEIEELPPDDSAERLKWLEEQRAYYDRMIKSSLSVASVLVTQIIRNNVNRIGITTGNTIRQQKLSRVTTTAAQLSGVALSFVINPFIGVASVAGVLANALYQEERTMLQRDRITKDNEVRLQVLGGISQRGNR